MIGQQAGADADRSTAEVTFGDVGRDVRPDGRDPLLSQQTLALARQHIVQKQPRGVGMQGLAVDEGDTRDDDIIVLGPHHDDVRIGRCPLRGIGLDYIIGEPVLAAFDPGHHGSSRAIEARLAGGDGRVQGFPIGIELEVLAHVEQADAAGFRIEQGHGAAPPVGLGLQPLQELRMASWGLGVGCQPAVIGEQHRFGGDAVTLVAPLGPAGQGAGLGRPIGQGVAVVDQLDLDVHRGVPDQIRRGDSRRGPVGDLTLDVLGADVQIIHRDLWVTTSKAGDHGLAQAGVRIDADRTLAPSRRLNQDAGMGAVAPVAA
jgi:hypothetical protein